MDWKDIVNTEDVDTPERFDAYLRDRANEAKLEEVKELVGQKLEELDGHTDEVPLAVFTEYLELAKLLGLNTTWWENAKSLTPSEIQSFAEVTDASDDR